MSRLRFQRVLLKLSGEALEGSCGAIDATAVQRITGEIVAAQRIGAQVAVVVGAGNIFRGMVGVAQGMDRTAADTMGMLATAINCLALESALGAAGHEAVLMSAIPMGTVCRPFDRARAVRHLDGGGVVLLAAGTGHPYFTTDTAAALRALELKADVLCKATTVDGIYEEDPRTNPDARRYMRVSYADVLARRLSVMDLTAITLCRENDLPLVVFNMRGKEGLSRIVRGETLGTYVSSQVGERFAEPAA